MRGVGSGVGRKVTDHLPNVVAVVSNLRKKGKVDTTDPR